MFGRLFDWANIHERGLGQVIPLAVCDFFEAANRVGDRGVLTRLAGEDFGDKERLRQKAFHAASAMHDQFVFFAQFIDTENRDDVLQFAVTLQRPLHAAGDIVVLLADISWIENPAGRGQRIHAG